MDIIYTYINNKNYTSTIQCDLSKAFDCIDHEILMKKLEYLGIRGTGLRLIHSYFKDRIQQVQFLSSSNIMKKSDWKKVVKGVPQGSILGPVMFILYVADLQSNLTLSIITQFADDTSVTIQSHKGENHVMKIKNTLIELINWFFINGLKLNMKKTKVLNFQTKNSKEIQIQVEDIENCNIVGNVTVLGISLDNKLNWNTNIETLSKKLTSICYSLRILSNCISSEILKTTYFSYCQSVLVYCLPIWFTFSIQHQIRIFKTSKNRCENN